jgi:tetratricopeptide (TPR) repeat protein
MPDDITFTLGWNDIDTNLLPQDAREAGTDRFRDAVIAFLQKQYAECGGKTQIIFNDAAKTLTVTWSKNTGLQTLEQRAIEAVNRQEYGKAIPLLKALIAGNPKEPAHRFRLGLIYKSQGRLDDALDLLGQALALDSSDHAVHQALGECHLQQGSFSEAEEHFRAAPESLDSRLGLAQSLEELGRHDEADAIYQGIITSAGHSEAGSLAKEGRTRIAHALLRRTGNERPDVVMYCLGALERFQSMTPTEIGELGKEIAILGMKGLDINDPDPKYTLRSWAGEFSGLHLVSIMYSAFQKAAPGMDVGIDFSKEYARAVEMLGGR